MRPRFRRHEYMAARLNKYYSLGQHLFGERFIGTFYIIE